MQTARRSAPASWGEWPADQARFDAAAARAMSAAQAVVAARDLDDEPVIELWMHDPDWFASMQFAPTSETVCIGAILIPALGLGWKIVWEPATDCGRLRKHDAHQEFERARLRDGKMRVI